MFEYGQTKSALGCHRAIQLFQHRSGSTQTTFKIGLLAFDRVVLFLKRPSHALQPTLFGYHTGGHWVLLPLPDLNLQAELAVWTKTERKITMESFLKSTRPQSEKGGLNPIQAQHPRSGLFLTGV
ncbi:hypothetical protein PSHT_04991 [Puccinia striiformis]|uniref:Uncharacterized protein n=1 Tax=Puccinia striiformis TaxID=27350 RepID=A0A2S4WBS1_9BASI|nr:hypothetical protein PSHT_04991 [Puccinia striiformis]